MPDLGRRAFTGFLWAGAAYAGGKVLVFVATLVLARLLVPSEFGLVAFGAARSSSTTSSTSPISVWAPR